MDHRARVILLSLLAIGFTLYNAFTHYDQGSLSYDEGDYYQAIRNGFWNNWMDADDVPTIEFIETGIKAVRGEITRSEMSKMIRSRESSAFCRHYHAPFAFHHPMLTRAVAPHMPEENQLRYGNFGLMILWILILLVLALREPTLFSPWLVLVPASANWIASACAFNMHIPFGLALITMMMAWYAFEKDRTKVWLKRPALFSLAVAICSVEYSLIVIAMLSLWTLITLYRRKGEWRRLLQTRLGDLLWLSGFILLLWPAGLIKLGVLKSYAMQAYIALFRLDTIPHGFASFRDMIEWKWTSSPMELLLLIGVFAGMIWGWSKLLKRGSLFVSFGVLVAIAYIQFNPSLGGRWYLFPVFSLAFVFWLHVMSERASFTKQRETVLAVIVAFILFTLAQIEIELPSYTKARHVRDAIATLSKPDVPIITVQGYVPPMAAYFPDRQVTGIHWTEIDSPEVQDSLEYWSKDHVVIIPHDIPFTIEPDTLVEDVVMFVP